MELRIATLGRVEITRGVEPVGRTLNAKSLALLIYLAVTAEPHSREQLANLLWGEMTEREAQTNLRKALSLLRPIAESYLVIEKSTVAFDRSQPYWLDVEELERETESAGRIATPHSLRELTRGEFLTGLAVKHAPEFEVWVLEQRERFRLRAVQLLEHVVTESLNAGDEDAAKEILDRLLGLDPWNEHAYRDKMLLLAQRGEKFQALAQYQSARKILQEEFGVEPSSETTALYERIRNAKPFGAPLPIFPTGFVGRAAEKIQMAHWLAQPSTRLITLLGPGGVGKTRLAVEIASGYTARFLHGVVFVSLQEAGSAEDLMRMLAGALQLTLSASTAPLEQICELLRDKHALLVLDAFEQVTSAAPLLGKILSAAPEVRMFVTSRERLALQWEQVLPVNGLAYGSSEMSDAAQLLLEQTQRISGAPIAAADTRDAIVRICRAVDGFPLALELAAGLSRTLSYETVAEQVERSLVALTSDLRDVEQRHTSLRAVFHSSWRALNAGEQAVLPRLAVFHSGFTVSAMEVVSDATIAQLMSLNDKALVRHSAPERYELHQVLREFALERLGDEAERARVLRRHADYYMRFLSARRERLEGAQQGAAVGELRAEFDNVRAAWRWTVAYGDTAMLDAAAPVLYRYLEANSEFREGKELFADAAERSQIAGARWGACLYFLNMNAEAEPVLTRALAAAPDTDDTGERAFCLLQLGNVAQAHAAFDEASAYYQDALRQARMQGMPYLECSALNNLGYISIQRGENDAARANFQEALAIAEEIGDLRGGAGAWLNLAWVEVNVGNYDLAHTWFERALRSFQELGDRRGASIALGNLGQVASILGHLDEAEDFFRQTLAVYHDLAIPERAANMLRNLAAVALKRNSIREARDLYQNALSEYRRIGARFGECFALNGLGKVALAEHDIANARVDFMAALQLAQQINALPRTLDSIYGLAQVEEARSNFLRAASGYNYLIGHPSTDGDLKQAALTRLEQLPPPFSARVQETGTDPAQMDELLEAFLSEPR